jgi:predicted dehydrogenase
MKRRQFLSTTAAAMAAPAILSAQSKAGKKYKTALIGSGWWGMNILREAIAAQSCGAISLCDVDADALEVSADEVNDLTGSQPKTHRDYRELLEKEKPEIVVIATPDHWHALPAIDALKAGAHVFLEKPTGHTILESRAILNTAKDAGRVLQMGLHRRIGPHHVSGMKFLKDGGAGDVGMVRMFVAGGGGAESPRPNAKIPQGMDWDMYCGPAPMRSFNRAIHPGGWRNFLDFANGTLGDWGVHWLDQVLWWTDEKYPKRIFSTGGRPIRGEAVNDESGQTSDAPDSQVATYEFESFTATWEHRKFGGTGAEKTRVGCYFYGTKGVFHMGWRDGWTFYPSRSSDKVVHEDPKFDNEKDGHNVTPLWANFIQAIETGKRPVADVEVGHQATTMSLLGMLSLKAGRSIEWDGEKEQIVNDPEANKLLKREYRAPWVYPTV